MPERHLLTFELSEEGAAQLSTSVWGGNELSLEPQGSDTRLIYQVRIVARPLRGR
jgi:hypothetical protein